jgi:hypothetical protein
MKKTIVVLSLLALVLMPDVSSSRTEPRSTKTEVDKPQVLYLQNEFRDIRMDLSELRKDLERISTSMSAHESVQSYLIRRSYENIGSMEGICRYMESMTGKLSHVETDKLAYYCHSQQYGAQQMRNHSNECLSNIEKMRTHILVMAATPLMDEAAEKIRSSSVLIDKVLKMLQQHGGEEKPRLHH